MPTFTSAACSEIGRFHREELCSGEFIRIARAYQCGGPRFQLTVDDVMTGLDRIVPVANGSAEQTQAELGDGVTVVIDEVCLQLLEGVLVDFGENGFMFAEAPPSAC
ncbi:Fe-S cluster assembly iron-binding protein IscA [Alicyclobacillus sacchari]|uniref:Fe-S cluster assembly iron-binding protein IscA n=1 Tax=Alicyclobacillus sacchari TaxID=392010 RepID=A0A4R8LUU9_9BACL|nr:iron-sulfur cluster assembly protein [Alicyclobacillus sacchari]TDY51318.1 Fe-S cluster assembly iron-binding protein IscA [Alicyclobacillus sacchari]GMA56620.1 hypothetical protein GCM10025858_11230 [Alicyclobacillus sacchari]